MDGFGSIGGANTVRFPLLPIDYEQFAFKFAHIKTMLGESVRFAYSEFTHAITATVLDRSGYSSVIDSESMPCELKKISSASAFEAYFSNVYVKLAKLNDRTTKIYVHGRGLGGCKKASEVRDFDSKNLCLSSISADEIVKKELRKLKRAGNCNRSSRIMIINKSSYPLIYSSEGTSSGYFFSDACLAFSDNFTIPAETGVGGIFHIKDPGLICGSIGYISFKVEIPWRTHIICCGFSTPWVPPNRCGIEIRFEDGNTDEFGRIKGYGIVPTGYVKDIEALCKTSHTRKNDHVHSAIEWSSSLTVKCDFTDSNQGEYTFTISNSNYVVEGKYNRYNGVEKRTSADKIIQTIPESIEENTKSSESVSKYAKSFPQRSNISSSNYCGINSLKINSSSSNLKYSTSSSTFMCSSNIHVSNEVYLSSTDILNYLQNDPDYQNLSSKNFDWIVAAIISGISIASGVALIIVTGGIATPGIILGSSVLISCGVSGLVDSLLLRKKGTFKWKRFMKNVALSSGLALITFAAGAIVDGIIGLALLGATLTQGSLRTISIIAKGLVSAGTNIGSYLIIEKSKGSFVQIIELAFEDVGNCNFGFSGYLGAKVINRADPEFISLYERQMSSSGKNTKSLFKIEENEELPEIEVIQSPISSYHYKQLFEEWLVSENRDADMVRILWNSPDIGAALGFNSNHLDLAITRKSHFLESILSRFVEIVREIPYGKTMKGLGDYVWRVNEHYLCLEISKSNSESRIDIQASLVQEELVLALA